MSSDEFKRGQYPRDWKKFLKKYLPVTPRVQKRAAPAPAINNNGVAITPTNAYL